MFSSSKDKTKELGPWSNRDLQDKFQDLILKLEEFHDKFGKEKHLERFKAISIACVVGLNLIYDNKKPKDAEQVLATVSGSIQAQLGLIDQAKIGTQGNSKYFQLSNQIHRSLTRLSEVMKAWLLVCQNKKDKKESKVEEINLAATHLLSKEELKSKIKLLETISATAMRESQTTAAFFRRLASHETKKTSVGSVMLGLAFWTAILSVLDHFNVTDSADEKLAPFKVQDVAAAATFVIALLLLIPAFCMSRAKKPAAQLEEVVVDDARAPLLDKKETAINDGTYGSLSTGPT